MSKGAKIILGLGIIGLVYWLYTMGQNSAVASSQQIPANVLPPGTGLTNKPPTDPLSQTSVNANNAPAPFINPSAGPTWRVAIRPPIISRTVYLQ